MRYWGSEVNRMFINDLVVFQMCTTTKLKKYSEKSSAIKNFKPSRSEDYVTIIVENDFKKLMSEKFFTQQLQLLKKFYR